MKLSGFNFVIDTFLDFMFPKRCIVCNKLLPLGARLCFCKKCLEEVNSYKYVYEITPKDKFYRIISGIGYENSVREHMIDYKFRQVEFLGKSYAYIVYKIWERILKDIPVEELLVICVPMHTSRQRSYNQTWVIAREFCHLAELDVNPDILVKKRGIKQISGMSKELKRIFSRDSFEVVNSWQLYGKTVILIDDIYTTGTTAGECANVLLNNGAKDVIVLTPCYTPKK